MTNTDQLVKMALEKCTPKDLKSKRRGFFFDFMKIALDFAPVIARCRWEAVSIAIKSYGVDHIIMLMDERDDWCDLSTFFGEALGKGIDPDEIL